MSKKLLLAKELHKPDRQHFKKRSILTKGIDDMWAADLIDMKKFSKEHKGYMYILNVIDTFSKFAWAIPIKNKDGVTVSKAFEKIIKSAKTQNLKLPNLLHIEKGIEFENKHFKNLLNNYGINMYHTKNLEKSAIVERLNRTFNHKLKIQFEVRNNKKMGHVLQNLLEEYNFKDRHKSIGMTPPEVNKSNEELVLRTEFKQSREKKHSKISSWRSCQDNKLQVYFQQVRFKLDYRNLHHHRYFKDTTCNLQDQGSERGTNRRHIL